MSETTPALPVTDPACAAPAAVATPAAVYTASEDTIDTSLRAVAVLAGLFHDIGAGCETEAADILDRLVGAGLAVSAPLTVEEAAEEAAALAAAGDTGPAPVAGEPMVALTPAAAELFGTVLGTIRRVQAEVNGVSREVVKS